jgi:hypothetical protein
MGLEYAEEFEFVMEDNSYIAVRQAGQVEVWTVDGEVWIGNLPEKSTQEDVEAALKIYSLGLDRGCEAGAEGMRARIRNLLGVR